jgi:cysteinyl-tRNA synthetase
MLKIKNTLSNQKESAPQKSEVLLYVCGMTVYDLCHLGHARSAIVFDLIRNYLEYRGWTVRFVKNFTDIDDKIIARANREGTDYKTIADRYIAAYEDDMRRLRVQSPTLAPKATEHIPEIITLIESLVAKGVAYSVDGNVYFAVEQFPSYGKLSRRNRDEMTPEEGGERGPGGRINLDPGKKSRLDFALWKAAKTGEPSWDSPWGPGRPGWHIECSAMAIKHLGKTIDFHGGGNDLIFPHHENEIAQSEAFTGEPFVRSFLHHGHVTIDREKMSKSLGNFFTVREIFEKSSFFSEAIVAEVLRYYLLSTHYRSPIDFSNQSLAEAKAGLDRFYTLFSGAETTNESSDAASERTSFSAGFRDQFEAAMDDDFNTAKAIGVLHQFRSAIQAHLTDSKETGPIQEAIALLRRFGKLFGIFQVPVEEWSYQTWETSLSAEELPGKSIGMGQEQVALLAQRKEARKRHDFAASDRIRAELAKQGYILEDRPDGTTQIKR